jgi:hypothetical protein
MGPGPFGPPYSQADFNRLADWGANYVNISHPGLFSETPPYELDSNVQTNLDSLLAMIARAGLFAVISVRTGPGRSEFTFVWDEVGDWFDESYLNDTVWEDQAAQDAWVAMWRYTAHRYRNHLIVVGYDLMVEPNTNEVGSDARNPLDVWEPEVFYDEYGGTLYDWNQLYPRITQAIREVDTDTPILVGGMAYSRVSWLPYMSVTGDLRTVYMVHQYEPYVYTHQIPPFTYTYPGFFDTDWDGESDVFDRDWLEDMMTHVTEFKSTHHVPVADNEFGAMRWEPGADAYMDDLMAIFEQLHMNHALWLWDTSWEPHAEEDAFDFRHGSDPNHHSDVESSPLMDVIKKYWALNTLYPTAVGNERATSPAGQIALGQNYPNPFNASTTIPFTLRKPGTVDLRIIDLQGRAVASVILHTLTAGHHTFRWHAGHMSSGIYTCRLSVKDLNEDTFNIVKTRKLILIK